MWDVVVRILHWSLVNTFLTVFNTTHQANNIHIYGGYTILFLVCMRVIWGFIGSHHAKFKNFLRHPRYATSYVSEVFMGTQKYYVGHNPAGGFMVVILLACLTMTSLSGIKDHQQRTGININGKSSINMNKTPGMTTSWVAIHHILSTLTLMAIAIHLFAIILMSLVHNEILPYAMITGKKSPPGSGYTPDEKG